MIDTHKEGELPPIDEDVSTDPDDDFIPTEAGQVRVYFNDRLMAWNHREFQLSFDSEDILDPRWLLFDPPVSMWPDEDGGEARAHLSMPDREIEIREQSVDTEMIPLYDEDESEVPRKRVWKPVNGEPFDFEIRMERTPYEKQEDGTIVPPGFEHIVGETTVEVECLTERVEPEICDGWSAEVQLNDPAYFEGDRLYLPGFACECPQCGDSCFEVDGQEVTFGV